MNILTLDTRTARNAVCAFLAAVTVSTMLTLGTVGIERMEPTSYGVITVSEI